jgi:hypothetical protein
MSVGVASQRLCTPHREGTRLFLCVCADLWDVLWSCRCHLGSGEARRARGFMVSAAMASHNTDLPTKDETRHGYVPLEREQTVATRVGGAMTRYQLARADIALRPQQGTSFADPEEEVQRSSLPDAIGIYLGHKDSSLVRNTVYSGRCWAQLEDTSYC